jgi:(R,R)-butanediol dehydrogenase/meso-butanediol dehydrogenase/diacetyl reductase
VTLGHEFCGTIAEIGAEVTGFTVGQKVAVNPAMDDRHHGHPACEQCLNGQQNLCERIAFYGLSQGGGGFAEQAVVKPVALIALPPGLSLKLAALAEPLAVAAHMIRISGFRPGQDVLILGAGPIGCALTLLLRAKGARHIIVSEVAASRATQARSLGADTVVNPTSSPTESRGTMEHSSKKQFDPVLEAVHMAMGSGAHVSFDACGLQSTLDTAIECTKPGGVVFNVAIHDRALQVELNKLVIGEKRLMGGICYTTDDFEEAVGVLNTRGDEAAKLITSIVPLSDTIQGGFQELIGNTANNVKLLIEACGEN